MLYAVGSVLEQVLDSLADVFYILRSVVASRIVNEKLMRSIFSSSFRCFAIHLYVGYRC